MGIAGLGAFAGGLTRGLQVGEQMADRAQMRRLREADQGFQDEQRARVRKQWSKDDEAEKIDAEFGNKVQEFSTPPGLAAAAAPASGAPQGSPPGLADAAQPKPRPTEDGLYRAMKWRTDALAKAGLMDKWKASFTDTEAMGNRLRQQTAAKALAKLQAGDASGLSDIYRFVNDGKEIKATLKGKDADGQPIYSIAQTDEDTGEQRSADIDYQAVLQMAQTALDPVKATQSAFERSMTLFKTNQQIKRDDAKEEAREKREVARDEARHGQRMKEIDRQGSYTLKAAGVRASGGSAGAGGSPRIQRTMVDSDGYMVGVFRDGTTRRLSIGGQPVRSGEWAKRVDKLAGDLGKGISGLDMTPEQRREKATQMLIEQDQDSAPAVDPGKRPSLESFQR